MTSRLSTSTASGSSFAGRRKHWRNRTLSPFACWATIRSAQRSIRPLAGSAVDGKGAEARRISKPQEALDCRILFVSSSEANHLKDILATLDKANILTVSDIPQFSELGGMIQFVLDGNKIRFEVNLTAAENAGLTLSSELLKVATAVRKNPEAGG